MHLEGEFEYEAVNKHYQVIGDVYAKKQSNNKCRWCKW